MAGTVHGGDSAGQEGTPLGTDASWERLAQRQPYWAVLSCEEFHGAALAGEANDAFWRTGEAHVAGVLGRLRAAFGAEGAPASVLDFGCGVGRLLVPFARKIPAAVGVDVSPTMLALARRHLDAEGLRAVTLADSLDTVPHAVDLVHSALVFQHIPPRRGYAVLSRLLDVVAPGGFGYLHLPLRNADGGKRRAVRNLLAVSGPVRVVANMVRGRPRDATLVSMFEYDAGEVLARLHACGITDCRVELATGDGGRLEAVFMFRKAS